MKHLYDLRSGLKGFDYNLPAGMTDPALIGGLQGALLSELVDQLLECSPHYGHLLREAGIRSSDIRSIEDIVRLPLTSKEDIQSDHDPFLSVDKRRVREVVSTTGTTGEPLFFALTEGDLKRLAENERRTFSVMGVGPGETVQVAVAMDSLFIAGLAYSLGLRQSGATIVRSGPRDPKRQIRLLEELAPSAIIAVPSFLLHLAKEAEGMGIDPSALKLEKALLIGETVRNRDFSSNNIGKMVENMWRVATFSTYGITEASIAFSECAMKRGMHAHPDFVFVEVLDDEGNQVADGEPGELVVTTFKVEGMPLLRYRTGDITFIEPSHCSCGNPSQRIGPIIGRKAHRLKVKGTTVYPGAIKNALYSLNGITGYQVIVLSNDDGTDRIKVIVGSENFAPGFEDEVTESIRAHARFTPELEVVPSADMEKLLLSGNSRKRQTFVDRR